MQGQIKDMQKYSLSNFREFYTKEGFKGLYRGYSISVFLIPIFNTIYFPTYEFIKKEIKLTFGWKNDEVRLYSASAGIAGLMCNLFTNPFWLVRTRMQVEIFRNDTKGHFEQKYSHGVKSLYINMREIVNKEGFLSLYKGVPASCIGLLHPLFFFPIYEKQKIFYKNKFEPDSDKLSTIFILASSTTSKFIASAVSYPHEVLRARKYYEIKEISCNKKSEGLIALTRRII